MLNQILIGTSVIVITIAAQAVFISISAECLKKRGSWLVKPPFLHKTIISLVAVVLWLVIGISLSAWLWAAVFLLTGALQELEPALYFSIVTFTTLGYGDMILDPNWRLLGSFTAVNGLIIFGLNTAFLVEFSSRLRHAQENTDNKINNTQEK